LLAEEVTKRGEVFRGQRVGRGSYLLLFLIFIFILLLIAISRGFGLGGSFLPPAPSQVPGSTPKSPPLLPCLLPFIVGTVGLLSRHILR
jgi:hypothetical protein